jgi:hypothetical protein
MANRILHDTFLLALILILVAYWAGTVNLLKVGIAGANTLGLTFTGRNQSGQFAGYPAGTPTS